MTEVPSLDEIRFQQEAETQVFLRGPYISTYLVKQLFRTWYTLRIYFYSLGSTLPSRRSLGMLAIHPESDTRYFHIDQGGASMQPIRQMTPDSSGGPEHQASVKQLIAWLWHGWASRSALSCNQLWKFYVNWTHFEFVRIPLGRDIYSPSD
jgi:hypothetical protein